MDMDQLSARTAGPSAKNPVAQLWPAVSEDAQLRDVVEHDVGEEDDDEDESDLVDAFFEGQIDVTANHALDEQEEDHAAIENGERHQVEDSKIDADGGHRLELCLPAWRFRCHPVCCAIPIGPESVLTDMWFVKSRLSTFKISRELSLLI